MISYTSPDGRKIETVRVAYSGLSLRATGYVVSMSEPVYGASYSVSVDGEGKTKRVTVRCDDADGERSLSLTRSGTGPWIAESATGSVPHPELAEAVDVYISGSAFAASLPLRRLGLHRTVGAEERVTVAAITLPDLAVTAIDHRGRTEEVSDESARIAYSGSYGERDLVVDSDGMLLSSAGLTERVTPA